MERTSLARGERHCADLAIVGAQVVTLDPSRPHATSLAVRAGVIVAVGDEDEVREHCDAATEVESGDGLTIVPGLVDAHQHPMWVTKFVAGADASAIRTLEALQAALAAERSSAGPDGVVRAWGLDYALFAPTSLDGGVLERLAHGPALVTFMDCHTHLATPSVMRLAGITGPVQFSDRSEVVMRCGEPTGELREFEAFDLVARALPHPAKDETATRVQETLRDLAQMGLTGVQVMDGDLDSVRLLRELESNADLPVRLVMPLWIRPSMGEDEIEQLLAQADLGGRRWRGGVAKFFLDGVIESGTAWLEEPDADGHCTRSAWPRPQRYAELVRRFARAGFQCATHAIGDRAIRKTLDAYRAAPAKRGLRHRIEHLETLADSELPRLARENVVASMQPLHMQWRAPDGSDEWVRRLGASRAQRAFRVRDVLRAGATLALGSDWPVAQRDPRIGMAWARLRRPPGDPGAHVYEPAQRLTAVEALAGYTTAAAYAVGEERVAGRIAPGLRADLTVFGGDPLRATGDELIDMPVAMTVLDGEITHRA